MSDFNEQQKKNSMDGIYNDEEHNEFEGLKNLFSDDDIIGTANIPEKRINLSRTYEEEIYGEYENNAVAEPTITMIPVKRSEKKNRDAKKSGAMSFVKFFGNLIYIALIVAVSVLLSIFIINCANDALALVKESKGATIVINENDTTEEIAGKLKDSGVINQTFAFEMFSKLKKKDGMYKSGEYELNAQMDYSKIISVLTQKDARKTIDVMIPEGYTTAQIINKFVENKIGEEDDYWEAVESGDYAFDFLEGLPNDRRRLEGYLFPNTYTFYVDEKPENVLRKLLNEYKARIKEEYKEQAELLGMTERELLVLASIIEKEAADIEEFTVVSSVFHNRLNNSSTFPYLQADATIQYALPQRKYPLTGEDTKLDDPYNTYMYKGLPPGPIANPSEAALYAAYFPDETGYYYFVVGNNGKHVFSKTLKEHEQAIKGSGDKQPQGVGTITS